MGRMTREQQKAMFARRAMSPFQLHYTVKGRIQLAEQRIKLIQQKEKMERIEQHARRVEQEYKKTHPSFFTRMREAAAERKKKSIYA